MTLWEGRQMTNRRGLFREKSDRMPGKGRERVMRKKWGLGRGNVDGGRATGWER